MQLRPVLAATALALVAACAPETAKQGPAASTPDPTSGATAAAARGYVAAPPAAPAATPALDGTDPAPAAAPRAPEATDGGEAAAPVAAPVAAPFADDTIAPRLAPGRSKHDMTSFVTAIRQGNKKLAAWPKGPTPAPGALLPARRIVAYYGNPLSKRMGVLGEYPVDEMLAKLDRQVAQWREADPATPVQPALHLIAVVAQGSPGKDGMWRTRMDTALIEKVYGWAKRKNAILFLDIQASHSTLQAELPRLLPYLARPDVHLGVDPEFYMHHDKEGVRPSAKIGQMRASDINYVINTLDRLVAEKRLPPKVLVVHRFTRQMVPDAQSIRPTSRVQVVMHMDGWGPPWLKFDSYHHYIVNEPVQFTGFKLFYHNDTKKGDPLLTPRELLQLTPQLGYIQYQ